MSIRNFNFMKNVGFLQRSLLVFHSSLNLKLNRVVFLKITTIQSSNAGTITLNMRG